MKLLIICGPTASGKSALAVECAKILDSEIISADSMNVYKGLDIGTAKPDDDEKQGIKHHLIDVADPKDNFTVGNYRELALPIVENLLSRNKIPIICGGTGFYINSLLYNYSYGKGIGNPQVREKYKELSKIHGNSYVYEILKEKDRESAEKLHPNDLKRVIRALEIFENGIKKSDIRDDMTPRYEFSAYSFLYPREELYSRIDARVDKMIEYGLINEVKNLQKDGITLENQCMQGIGYKEIYGYLTGEYTLSEAIELIKLNTRHYAKRQITFFKKMSGLQYLESFDIKSNAAKICERIYKSI